MRKSLRCRRTVVEALESRFALDARFVISEFMAQNNTTVDDGDGDASDWIEIFNAGDAAGNLNGWTLAAQCIDESEVTWTFPSVELPPDGFRKVFASRKDRSDPSAELHTNFTLEKSGGTVRLLAPDSSVATQFDYPDQREDASYGYGMSEQYAVVNVAPINPATLGPYVLLRADAGVATTGGNVTQWVDQSANGFVFQANHPLAAGNDPSLIAGPNGTSAINFDGTDIIDSNADLQLFTANDSGLTLFVVLRPTASGGQRFVVNHAPGVGGDSFEMGQDAGQVAMPNAWGIHRGSGNATSTPANALATNQFQVMTTELLGSGDEGDNVRFLRNGVSVNTTVGNWLSAGGYHTGSDQLAIGARVDNKSSGANFDGVAPNSFFQGDVAEVVVIRRVLTPAERAGVEQFLGNKYALGYTLSTNTLIGIDVHESQTGFFKTPTFGTTNGTPGLGFVADTNFDGDIGTYHGRGYYDAPFDVTISSATPGATIVYTTDGSTPSPTNGIQVASASSTTPPSRTLNITTTTTLRAMAFKTGFESTNVDTQTYLFIEGTAPKGIVNQPTNPAGFPTSGWGRAPTNAPDYQVDPDVVNNPAYSQDFRDGLTQIPTISIVTDQMNLFGATGIYSNPNNTGPNWERTISFEYFDPTTGENLQTNAGLRIHGGVGRSTGTKLSLRVYFRGALGDGKFVSNIFDDTTDVTEFDKLVLRAQWNDGLHHPAPNNYNQAATYIRDEFSRRAFADMGHLASAGNYAHLYINGLYWGLYNPVERVDGDFLAEHLGGEDDDYDVIKINTGEGYVVDNGDDLVWKQLTTAASADLTSAAGYAQVTQLLDVESFADFMVLYLYIGNEDGPAKGQYAYRRRGAGEKFEFTPWDNEWTLGKSFSGPRNVNSNRVADNGGISSATGLFQRLRTNAEFRLLFADRVNALLGEGGVLSPAANVARWTELMNQIRDPFVGESARWGDFLNELNPGQPLARDVEWAAENNWVLNSFFPQRGTIVTQQLNSAGLLPTVNAPVVSPRGGSVVPGTTVTISGSGGGGTTNPDAPIVVANAIGTRPALRFDGTDRLVSTDNLQFFPTSSSPLTTFIVFNTTNADGQRFLLNQRVGTGATSQNFELGIDTGLSSGSGNLGLHRGSGNAVVSPVGTVTNNENIIFTTEVRAAGTSPANVGFFKNGADLTEANNVGGWLSAGSYYTSSAQLYVGARLGSAGTLNSFHTGDIAEIIVVQSALTTEQRQGIERYLSERYAIAGPTGSAASPAGLPGLALWLKADTGVTLTGGAVSEWVDQSPNGHRFTVSPPAPLTNTPEFVASALNDKPSIRFDGADDILYSNAGIRLFDTASSGLTVFTVFDTDNNSGQKFLFNQGLTTDCMQNFELGYDTGDGSGAGNFGIHRGCGRATVTPANTISNNEFSIIATQFKPAGAAPANVAVFKNGVSAPTSVNQTGWIGGGNYNTATARINIGGRDDGGTGSLGSFHDGDIAEIIVFKRELSAAERSGVEKYLSEKYAVGVASGTATLPRALADLEVWLKADAGVVLTNGLVSSWTDQSAHAYVFSADKNAGVGPVVPVENGIYYTLDGSDPRLPGGSLSPSAIKYDAATPPVLGASATLIARSVVSNVWSASTQTQFTVELPIRITEMMYHPGDRTAAEIAAGVNDDGDFEYIELFNKSATETIELGGMRFIEGIELTLSDQSLAPGEYGVVVRSIMGFRARYGNSIRILGEFGGTPEDFQLSNSGERITLIDAGGGLIQTFAYTDDWYPATDGSGNSLVIRDATAAVSTWENASAWRASLGTSGSPGRSDTLPGDLNGDGIAGLADLAILQRHFGKTSGATLAQGDLTGDGMVNRADVARFVRYFGLGGTLGSPSPVAASQAAANQASAIVAVANSRGRERSPSDSVRRTLVAARVDAELVQSADASTLRAERRSARTATPLSHSAIDAAITATAITRHR
jgi:hypothetical protein